ncbi:MAG: sensor histidine kinase, partial [Bacteroidota bacterium]
MTSLFQFDKIYTRWTAERLLRHAIYWTSWLVLYATINSSYTDYSFGEWALAEMVIMFVKLPFTYTMIYFLLPNFLARKRFIPFILISLVLATIGATALTNIYRYIIYPVIFDQVVTAGKIKRSFYLMLDLIYISCFPLILKLVQQQIQQQKMTFEVAKQKLGAELKLLKNQLHPHFLFNTLNHLYGMVLTQDTKAADAVVRLSNMMSYMLYECEKEYIDLEKEIEHLRNYIELEKMRFGERLDVSFTVAEGLEGKRIAPLLLIPFVENAFKHSVEKDEQKSWVCINFWLKENRLIFSIENSLPAQKQISN